ncbi:MAG: UvrD-helicase domain-containing protein [Treponema sp.]|jgi:exodeoxyribonuclease V beta subunit|nr:UvrD-helicase domain-containing protein [Treponema sp.]
MKTLNVVTLPLDNKVLIEASAGTGKTYTIGLLVVRLLLEKLIPIEKIVLITFTEAATNELKKNTAEKIRQAYDIWKNGSNKPDDFAKIIENAKKENAQDKENNLLDAIARIDEMPIFTIHGFCRKLLSEFAFETGNFEEKEVIANVNDIKYRVIADFWRENIKDRDMSIELSIDTLSSAIDIVLNHPDAEITGEDYNNPNLKDKALQYAIAYKLAKEINKRLTKEKQKLKIMNFNDMIEDCHKAIRNDSQNNNILQNAIKKRFDAIMVDEFQDTDKIQYEIINYLFINKPLIMIGDPKQAIYRFRGGDINAYKQARESAKENQYSMNTNYRSEKTLLDAMNVFFTDTSFRDKMGDGIDYYKIDCGNSELLPINDEKDSNYKPFVIWKGVSGKNNDDFSQKAQKAVVSEIKRLLSTEKIEPGEITILLNKNADCLEYKNILAKEGIHALYSGGSVFASEAAYFLRILLNAICFFNKTGFVRALLTHYFCSFEPKDINDNLFIEWIDNLQSARAEWEKNGVMNAVDFILTKKTLWSNIAASVDGERNIRNIRHIMEILNNDEIKQGNIPEKIINCFGVYCSEQEYNDEYKEKLETDEKALKIMTLHSSKGLQFNIVFIPDISRQPNKHRFPHVYMFYKNDKKNIAYIEESKNGEKELNDTEENEETARLLYVAITRAKFRLYIAHNPCYPRSNSYLRKILDDFCASNTDSQNIQIEDLEKIVLNNYEYKQKNEDIKIKKEAKQFNKKIEPSWYRTSFTGISLKLQQSDFIPVIKKTEEEPPAGKRMGTLLHSIFENLDFDAKEKDIQNMVDIKLGGYKEFTLEKGEARKNWIIDKVRTILNKNLHEAGRLCDIKDANKVTELNFFMSSPDMKLEKIKEILGNKINNFEKDNFIAEYIKGAIDLVFLGKDGKYYILDWKSNSLNNFTKDSMEKEAMIPHGYHLQYYIYSVALKRWLERTKKKFDFAKQFGGVYYLFIRGISNIENNYDGIYFASSEEIAGDIINLDNCFGENINDYTL